MAKKNYILENKDWLIAKAQEEGVKPLARGVYYKVLASGLPTGRNPRAGVSSRPTIRAAPSMGESLTPVGVAWLLPSASPTLSRDGS